MRYAQSVEEGFQPVVEVATNYVRARLPRSKKQNIQMTSYGMLFGDQRNEIKDANMEPPAFDLMAVFNRCSNLNELKQLLMDRFTNVVFLSFPAAIGSRGQAPIINQPELH